MMQCGVIRASTLGDRWGADFHLALASVRKRVAEISAGMTRTDALALLARLPTEDKRCLEPLKRGQSGTLAAAEDAYPFVALALLEAHAADGVERIMARIEREKDALDALLAIETLARAPHGSIGSEAVL